MSKKGHFVFVSEYEMPEDFKCIWSKQITNAMHQTNTKKSIEKLFTL
jgi:DNA adenine methylase